MEYPDYGYLVTRGTLALSSGMLVHARGRTLVEVCPDIAAYAFSLIPRYLRFQTQRYRPHITVAHEELGVPGELEFYYSPVLQVGDVYAWLDVFCPELESIRVRGGLEPSSWYTRPPSGTNCFHITVGNRKQHINIC